MMERCVVDMYDSDTRKSCYDSLFTYNWVIKYSDTRLWTDWDGQVLTLAIL